MRATWVRVDQGNDQIWGVRVEAEFSPLLDALVGQTIEVVRKNGVVSLATVTAILKRFEPRPAVRINKRRRLPEITKPFVICRVAPTAKRVKYGQVVWAQPPASLVEDVAALIANVSRDDRMQREEKAAAERSLAPRPKWI